MFMNYSVGVSVEFLGFGQDKVLWAVHPGCKMRGESDGGHLFWGQSYMYKYFSDNVKQHLAVLPPEYQKVHLNYVQIWIVLPIMCIVYMHR